MTTSWQIQNMPLHTTGFSTSTTSNSAYGRWFPASGVSRAAPGDLSTARRLGVLSAPNPDPSGTVSRCAAIGHWNSQYHKGGGDLPHADQRLVGDSTRALGKLGSVHGASDHHGAKDRYNYSTPDAGDIALFKRKMQTDVKENVHSGGGHDVIKLSPRDRQMAAANQEYDMIRTGYASANNFTTHRSKSFSNNLINGSPQHQDASKWQPLSNGMTAPAPPDEPRTPYRSIVGIQRSTTTIGSDAPSSAMTKQHELSLYDRVMDKNSYHPRTQESQPGKTDDLSVMFAPSRPLGEHPEVRRPLSNTSENTDMNGSSGSMAHRKSSSRYWMNSGNSSRNMGEVRSRMPSLQHRGSFVYQLELGKNKDDRVAGDVLENGEGPLCLSLNRDVGLRSAKHDPHTRRPSLTADDLEAFRKSNAELLTSDGRTGRGHVLLYSPRSAMDLPNNRLTSATNGVISSPKSILKKSSKYGPPLPSTYSAMTGKDMALLAQEVRVPSSGSMRRTPSSSKRVTFRLLHV